MALKCIDIEIAVSEYFDWRRNLIIPNVSWGLGLHECDLLIMTQSRYLYEVEIKVSKSDLKKDLSKRHGHNNDKIKRLYFAMPNDLRPYIDLIPERAGIILVSENGFCNTIRTPVSSKAKSLTIEEAYDLARLGVLRIFPLKSKIRDFKKGVPGGLNGQA